MCSILSSRAFVLLVAYTMGGLIEREYHGARKEDMYDIKDTNRTMIKKGRKKTPVCMHASTDWVKLLNLSLHHLNIRS